MSLMCVCVFLLQIAKQQQQLIQQQHKINLLQQQIQVRTALLCCSQEAGDITGWTAVGQEWDRTGSGLCAM